MNMKNKKKNANANTSFIAFIKVFAFIVPLPLYLLFTVLIFPAPNSGFLFVGIVGSLAVGGGLLSVSGLIDGMYFGHAITCIIGGVGATLITVSSLVMYVPSIYSAVDEQYVSFYFLIWLALMISTIWYMLFRMGVSQSLRSYGLSKTAISKAMKGKKNYWLYEAIHKSQGLGWMYYLNKWFIILYAALFLAHLLVGWWRAVSSPLLAAACVMCVLDVALWVPVCFTQSNEKSSKGQRANSTGAVLILGLIFPILICISLVLCFLKMQ